MYDINGTKQEIFDRVVTHLAQQGEPALCMLPQADYDTDGPSCAYRTPQGLKCAAGCLIPDEKYKPEFENEMFRSILSRQLTCDPMLIDLINSLQIAHDARTSKQLLQNALYDIAREYKLNADSVNLITEWRI